MDIPSILWLWYEELFHFLDFGEMPPFLTKDQRCRLALRSQNFAIVVSELYYHTINDILPCCVLPHDYLFVL